jgi:hypothetical protein
MDNDKSNRILGVYYLLGIFSLLCAGLCLYAYLARDKGIITLVASLVFVFYGLRILFTAAFKPEQATKENITKLFPNF